MNIEGAVDWVKEHKAAAAAGIAAVLLAGLWMWHRSKVASEQYQQGDTNGESGYTTPGGGQYLIPTSGVDGGGTSGDVAAGDSGAMGDILAALNDLTTEDAAIAAGLGTVADTLKGLQPTKPTDTHKGKGHKGRDHKPGGHGHGGTTKTPHPTHGGHGHGGHTGHTAKPKHPVIKNPNKPAAPSKAQRKAATGHQSKTTPHRPAKPAVVTHAPTQPKKTATKAPAKAPARRKAA